MVNKKFIFDLKSDSPPHITILQIKEIIEKDGYLHPTMKKLLLLMKKSRMNYIILGKKKEVIINEKEFYQIDRSLDPLTGFNVSWLTKQSKENIEKDNKEEFYDSLIKFYENFGYMLTSSSTIEDEIMNDIASKIKFPKKEDD